MPGFGVANNLCIICADKNCADYSNGVGNCRSCWPGYGLHLINGSSNYRKCLSCDVENCTKCDGHVSICAECIENYYLINNKCENNPNIENSINNGNDEEFFKIWTIVVIVVVGVIVIGVVIFLIVYCCKKKVKVGSDSSSV